MFLRPCFSVIAAAAVMLPMAASAAPSAKDAPATLKITYELTGGGAERPSSGEKNVTWTVRNSFDVTMSLKATKAQGTPSMHKADPAQQAAAERAGAAGAAAAGDAAPLMEEAQKIFEKCGDDEACIERESLKLAENQRAMEQAAKAGQSAKAAGEAAGAAVPRGERYQNFGGGQSAGTYTISETAHEAYFDAACSPRNEATCSIDTTVKGAGALQGLKGETSLPATAGVEVDYQAGTAMVFLALPGFGKATKTVKSGSPDRASGVEEVLRAAVPEGFGAKTLGGICAAGCASASGEFSMETIDPLLRRPATLKITWKFTRP